MAAYAEHPTRTMTEQNLTNEIAVSPVTINKSLGDVYDDSSNFPVSAVQRATAMIAAAAQIQPLPKYLAIEGPIGVGKTTLARKLADVRRRCQSSAAHPTVFPTAPCSTGG